MFKDVERHNRPLHEHNNWGYSTICLTESVNLNVNENKRTKCTKIYKDRLHRIVLRTAKAINSTDQMTMISLGLYRGWYCVPKAMTTRVFIVTSSNGNIFRVIGSLWGETTGHRWIPLTKASDAELRCLFYLHLNKRLNKQWRWRWFKTPSHPLWCHCHVIDVWLLAQ